MRVGEYDEKLMVICKIKDEAIKKLNIEYALANNPYEIGQIIRDHYHTIKIEKIGVCSGNFGRHPFCSYTGLRYKKDLTPFKSGDKSTMYQSNVKEKLN